MTNSLDTDPKNWDFQQHLSAVKQWSIVGPDELVGYGLSNRQKKELTNTELSLVDKATAISSQISEILGSKGQKCALQLFWINNNSKKNKDNIVFVRLPATNNENSSESLIMLRGEDGFGKKIVDELLLKGISKTNVTRILTNIIKTVGGNVQPESLDLSTIGIVLDPLNDVFAGLRELDYGDVVDEIIENDSPPSTANVTAIPPEIAPEKFPTALEVIKPWGKLVEIVTPDEESLGEIDATVTNRQVGSKFSGEVNIHGVSFTSPEYNLDKRKDYEMHPHGGNHFDYLDSVDETARAFAVTWVIRKGKEAPDSVRQFLNEKNYSNACAISYFRDGGNESISHLFISMPERNGDSRSRRTFYCHLACELPSNECDKLIKLIVRNPDNAERFIQIAFAGIDKATERIPVDAVAIIDVENYIPKPTGNTRKILRDNPKRVLNFLQEKGRLNTDAILICKFRDHDELPQYTT